MIFMRFPSGNFDINYAPRSEPSIRENVDEIIKKVYENTHLTTNEITQELNKMK